jgi:hypothetical protein
MADTLALNVNASVDWLFKESLDLSNVSDAAKLELKLAITDGTGSGLADKIWHDTRSLTAAAADNLDLTALTTTIFGSTVTISFVKLKGIFIVNNNAVSGDDLTIGNGAAPFNPGLSAATTTWPVYAGSQFLWVNKYAGWTVTNTTADILKINNGSPNTVSYSLVLWGTSA